MTLPDLILAAALVAAALLGAWLYARHGRHRRDTGAGPAIHQAAAPYEVTGIEQHPQLGAIVKYRGARVVQPPVPSLPVGHVDDVRYFEPPVVEQDGAEESCPVAGCTGHPPTVRSIERIAMTIETDDGPISEAAASELYRGGERHAAVMDAVTPNTAACMLVTAGMPRQVVAGCVHIAESELALLRTRLEVAERGIEELRFERDGARIERDEARAWIDRHRVELEESRGRTDEPASLTLAEHAAVVSCTGGGDVQEKVPAP